MKKQEFREFIKEVVRNVIRENWEPYDGETDQFGDAPRDRLQGEENGLGIPEFPQSIVKQHDMDGEQRWFVYSSSEPTALIIGYGKSQEDAVSNARTTAKYIKHGGVGHTGELKEDGQEYDERGEMKKINDILVVCEHANKRLNDPTYFPTAIKQIQKICIDLLRMHGAK
jgi:hypothetical protein